MYKTADRAKCAPLYQPISGSADRVHLCTSRQTGYTTGLQTHEE